MPRIDTILEQIRELAYQQANDNSRREPLPIEPWSFCQRCVWTLDEHAGAHGLQPIRQFPTKAYLRELTEIWQRERLLRVEKSRQLMISWLMAALHLHAALVNRGERIAWQSKNFADADSMLRDRLWHIFLHIPNTFQKPKARYLSGLIEVYHDTEAQLPTSQIMAIAQGADQLRQYTFSRILSDEFSFQESQRESYAAMRPTIDGGGRLTIVSSANAENFFWELGHRDLC